jgi:hypothetical protein
VGGIGHGALAFRKARAIEVSTLVTSRNIPITLAPLITAALGGDEEVSEITRATPKKV